MTAVDGMDYHVKTLVCRFKEARAMLEQWKVDTYPNGTIVYIEFTLYAGYGIVQNDYTCPPDRLSVLLENGNQLWCPVVTVIDASSKPRRWPTWIKNKKKKT